MGCGNNSSGEMYTFSKSAEEPLFLLGALIFVLFMCLLACFVVMIVIVAPCWSECCDRVKADASDVGKNN